MKVILITGVSSGFGLAKAGKLADQYKVFGSVRTMPPNPVEGIQYILMDVTDQGSVEEAVSSIIDQEGKIDVLINNAGIGIAGPVECTSDEEAMKLMNVNFFGVHRVTRAVLTHMRRQKSGTLIFMNSIGGLMGLPYQGFYSASKFAMEGYSQALRIEVRKFNIRVVSVYPGDFSTCFTNSRRIMNIPSASAEYSDFESALQIIELNEKKGLRPDLLARKILHIIRAEKPGFGYIVASPLQKFSVIVKKILPQRSFAFILRKFYHIR
jgi:short-subunit dehydrogenase